MAGVINHAVFLGWRPEGQNPAAWKGFLDQGFIAPRSRDVEHYAALDVADAPAFAAELRQRQGIAARALELLLLSATRTGDVRFAKWEDVDLERRTWVISKTKNGSALDVHLSGRAFEILQALPRQEGNPFVFGGTRPGQLSIRTTGDRNS